MSAKNSAALVAATSPDREIVFTREFDAPQELVWEAWADPETLDRLEAYASRRPDVLEYRAQGKTGGKP
jgi:uncharacterized protein YndB with AHSA1/START domain